MIRCPHRFMIVAALIAVLVPLTSVLGASSPGLRARQGMRSGMMPAANSTMPNGSGMFHAPQTMVNPFMRPPTTGGLGLTNFFQPNSFFTPNYGRGYSPMAGGYGSGYGMGYGMGGYGGGYSGGSGYGSNTMRTNGNLLDNPYSNAANSYGSAQSQDQNSGGPLIGLLSAQGGLNWPLALRILPPGLEMGYLRYQIDVRAREVQRQSGKGQVDAGLLQEMNRDIGKLKDVLADKGPFLPISQQAVANAEQFIQSLQEALKTAR